MNYNEVIKLTTNAAASDKLLHDFKLDFTGMDEEQKKFGIVLCSKMIKLIEELGWYEHTADWDPIIMIDLENGDRVQSEFHYADFEILKFNHQVSVAGIDQYEFDSIKICIEDDGEHEKHEIIEINEIKTIEFGR